MTSSALMRASKCTVLTISSSIRSLRGLGCTFHGRGQTGAVPTGIAPRRSGLRFVLAGFVALPVLAAGAHAGPDRVSILVASQHLGASVSFEQVNPGVFVTWEDRALGLDYTVGAYRNSYGRGSVAATAALPVLSWSTGEVSLFGGVALYPGDGRSFSASIGDFVPVGGLQLRQGNVFGQIMPGDGRIADAVVSLGFTFNIGADQ